MELLQSSLLHTIKAQRDNMMTIDELAEKYELHPDYVKSIIERTEGLAIKGNVAYVPKQSSLLPILGVAVLFFVIVILPMLAN
ncbi:hypothetical protein MHH84_03260 [Bacillus sp. FSL K6-1109]|uniref:hypothetical protein n=1 Tax=Bacillus TaxID=1386 RepID=UPI0002E7D96B|nr:MULTISPECIES: hypothetical protein [Bacillus subtilis group]ARC76573.1 hypothetical protein B37_04606 [Bacillus licheniformis]ARW52667.1 hypothetical protein S100027_00650 [Bacillus licheniformis]AXF87359.1 hypothetical protein BLDA23_03240 [Bacillus licheniformis]MCA1180104.1 hypothetical protein [Bacillus licheniformis]MEC1811005.1 hypothetical protein [Bacillus licheniformis]